MANDSREILGIWIVKFRQWTWEYTCSENASGATASGPATWRDPNTGDHGSGHWYINGNKVEFTWTGSTATESWNCPISDDNSGWYKASYGTGPLTSKRKGGTWNLGRGLTADEINLVTSVFGSSLSRTFLASKVMLHGHRGIGNRPFTAITAGLGRYEIYMGESAFDPRASTKNFKDTLIHEMTHVWQGHHHWYGVTGVWLSSIKCQVCRQGNAYLYGEGNLGRKEWGDFGMEEQAQIVEDWYTLKMSTTDPRFQYIRDNIRKGET